jgi:hypothetical protein
MDMDPIYLPKGVGQMVRIVTPGRRRGRHDDGVICGN